MKKPQDKKMANPIIRRSVLQLVGHYYPRKKITVRALDGGITNHVFLVHAGKNEMVVRISEEKEKINSFLKEQWAVTKARARKIPVPEIIEVGNTIIPFPYMISAKVRGVVALDHPHRKEILFEMGRLAARIHKIGTHGYGNFFDWSSDMLSHNIQWKDFLEGELDYRSRLGILKEHRMLSSAAIKKITATINKLSGSDAQPCLQHGDLRLKNMMVDKTGKITAILDWEDCISAIGPAWDISIALHDLPIEGQQRFLEGYGLKGTALEEIGTAYKTFNLLNYAPVIAQLSQEKKEDELEWYRSRMQGAMDLFSF
ncbi:MAG TPA: aminoglycoside phosphotransferase family protein [Chitinophagaceae bacterium]|nr:aminoglycoside phosphotransferase family protein [Chitinophagaceae bacterium]